MSFSPDRVLARGSTRALFATVVTALAVSVAGCSDEGACEDAAAALCAKACSCNDNCGITTKISDSETGFQAFSDKEQCVATLEGSCGETGTEDLTDEDYDACSDDAAKAECVESGVVQPASCEKL